MSTEVLLDLQGDLPAPSGYQVIQTEVEFLRHATDDIPLLIRGEGLCAWAEAFYSLRGKPFRYQESLSAALQRTFPALSHEQANQLARRMDMGAVSTDQISTISVLNRCYPDDYALWQGAPSPEHAAHWLLWIFDHNFNEAEAVILKQFAAELERKSGTEDLAALYRAVNREEAKSLLWRWLGGRHEAPLALGAFPLVVPDVLLKELKNEWMRQIIASKGAFFARMLSFPLPLTLRQELAGLTAQFFLQNPFSITKEALRELHQYLETQTLTTLEERLKPLEPSLVPQEEAAVLEWFQTEYMPYRCWQARFGDEHARNVVVTRAQAFTHWYLQRYPLWVLEPGWLSFQLSSQLQSDAVDTLTLCVILDGLPAWDAEDFIRAISVKIERLSLQQKSYCFAPLPTVTEFSKDALLKGVPPRLAINSPPLGQIIPDNTSPKRGLEEAQIGEVVFWRVAQPDASYHFENNDKRERQVRAELDSILQALQEVVEELPADIPLRIILTSDHGRLLNAKSPRRLPIPTGMQAHGRVAWGKLDRSFGETGFEIDENAGWIDVFGERFEMMHDLRIAWGEESFKNIQSGYDPYPHGGLFPEEAIIPWFVLMRDAKPPVLDISINGKGEAGNVGTLEVRVTNPSSMELECLSISFSQGVHASISRRILPLTQETLDLPLSPWPAKTELPTLKAKLLFRQPNGVTFSCETIPSIEVQSLYERDETLLKDLGL